MTNDLDRDIPDTHEVTLRQATGTQAGDPIPDKVREKYWELKRVFDRAGTIVTPNDLCQMLFSIGTGKPLKKELEPPTIVDLWRQRKILRDAKVVVDYRDKKHNGVLKNVNGQNQVVVQLIDDEEALERTFDTKLVSPAA
jgi:hypothetical protein